MNWMSIAFSALFTLEILMRLSAYGVRFWCGEGWAWNYFDFALVAIGILESVGTIAYMSEQDDDEQSDTTNNSQSFRVLRIIRVARVLRALRVARVMHFVRA